MKNISFKHDSKLENITYKILLFFFSFKFKRLENINICTVNFMSKKYNLKFDIQIFNKYYGKLN